MLTHIVCFKYKPEVHEAARADHRGKLPRLAGIGGLLDLTVGADIVGSPRSYDTGLIVRFADRGALEAYQKHPQHVPVAQHGVSLCEHIVAVDFED
jgi:hypothetical protein